MTTSTKADAFAVAHDTFTVERVYSASPAAVFAAHAEEAKRRRWLAEAPGFEVQSYSLDFRVGGRETSQFTAPGGVPLTYDAVVQDVVPDERIVASYSMTVAGMPLSVSLATTLLHPEGTGTRLVYTEQGTFFGDENDIDSRAEGCREILERLAQELDGKL